MFVLIAMYSIKVIHTLGSPAIVNKAARFLFPKTLMLVLLLMLYDYFNSYECARNLGIAA
jgi:hypothetical protein